MEEVNEAQPGMVGPFLLHGEPITKEFIESCKTPFNGFTRLTLKLLTGDTHPSSGWKKRVLGKRINDSVIERIRGSIVNKYNKRIKREEKQLKNKQTLEAIRPKIKKQSKPEYYTKQYKGNVNSQEFLSSYEWRQIRMVVLKRDGARCSCCGASPETGEVMHVDHIKPRRKFPRLALDPNNLQVLCEECNHGKGFWDETDWRNKGVDFYAPWGGRVGNQ
jgi:hypothetical protein